MNHHQRLKYIIITLYKFIFICVYKFLSCLIRHDKKKVVFVLSRAHELEGNLKFVYDELIKQSPKANIHFIYAKNKMGLKLFKEVFIFSNARYLILDDYYLPIYLVKPNNKLKVIQLWHAGAFKKFGYSTVGTRFGPDSFYLKLVPIHSNYTNVYISSAKLVRFYAEGFNMNPKYIFPIGIPRIDLFSNKKLKASVINQIFADYPSLVKKDTVNILIAPTYRAKESQTESTFSIIDSIIEIANLINKNKKIIFKAHPYMNDKDLKKLKRYSNIFIANKYSINEWMLISDAFITDYSSSIFEFSLLKRPLAHFVPDIDMYIQNRGFYQDINIISDGTLIRNNNQLVEWINARRKNEFFDSSRMVNYNFDNTKNVTKKIVEHFIS